MYYSLEVVPISGVNVKSGQSVLSLKELVHVAVAVHI